MTPLSPRCPRCGYDLQGQVATWAESSPLTGTCSECGLALEFAEVFDPGRSAPAWSFEREGAAGVGSAARTLWESLRPGRFWGAGRMRMGHPVRARRLVVYAAMGLVVAHAIAGLGAAIGTASVLAPPGTGTTILPGARVYGSFDILAGFAWPEEWLAGYPMVTWTYTLAPPGGGGLVYNVAPAWGPPRQTPQVLWWWFCLAWTALCPVAFLVLPATLRRCRVRRVHLARAGVYIGVATLLAWASLWFAAVAAGTRVGGMPWMGWGRRGGLAGTVATLSDYVYLIGPVMAAVQWHAWRRAAGRYLRLPRPGLIALAMVTVSFLAATAVMVFLPGSDAGLEFRRWLEANRW